MRIMTPADTNLAVAVAIGRFSQSCNYLEKQLHFLLTRLLPLTTDMGRVLLAGNQMRRNIEILDALLQLPEVPVSDAERERLKKLPPRLKSVNDDRSRFLHNPMSGGMSFGPDSPAEPLMLSVERQDGRATAYPVSVELIDQRTAEAKSLWAELYTNPVEYDLSKWGAAFTQFAVQPYPTASQPKAGNRKARRQSARQGQAPIDATQGSGEEPPR